MTGETDLATLLKTMRPVLHPEVYVFATLKPGEAPPASVTPIMTFRESEGLALIVPQDEARAAGLDGAFPSRMITLDVHSSLSAVGFLETVTARLAAAGISVNAVSAYFHDHLFVPAERAEEAHGILQSFSAARS